MKPPLVNIDHASRKHETALGNFVADALRKCHSAQIGWINDGGLHADAPGADFTIPDAYAITRFDNKVVRVKVSGASLVRALEQAVAEVDALGGGFPRHQGPPTRTPAVRKSDPRSPQCW